MGEVWYRTAALYAMSEVEEQLPALFPRIQFGVSVAGGSERAAHLIANMRALLGQQHNDVVVLSTDFRNAFNAASRTLIRRAVMGDSRCCPLWRLFDWSYGDSSPLYVYDRAGHRHATLESRRGVRQGDPLAAFAFALCVQPLYEAVVKGLPGVHAIAVQDDLTLVGAADDVFVAFDRLKQLAPDYCLDLQSSKCQLLLPADGAQHADIKDKALQRELPCSDSLLTVLGTRLACSAAAEGRINDECMGDVLDQSVLFERLAHETLVEDPQVGQLLLWSCALPRMNYAMRTTQPRLIRAACARFDADAMRAFSALTGLRPERLTPAQQQQLTLPLSAGGLGMRPTLRTSPAAFLAAGLLALTDLIAAAPAGSEARWPEHPLCGALQRCVDDIAATGADVAAAVRFGLLDGPASGLWQRLQALLSSAERADLLAHLQTGTQRALTAAMEQRILADAADPSSAPVEIRTRLVATSTTHSSRALTVLPTEADFRLSPVDVRSWCNLRMGRAPSERVLHTRCACQAASPFDRDPAHAHCCRQLKYGTVLRHNIILRALARFARMCGFSTKEEPASPARRDALRCARAAVGQPAEDDEDADDVVIPNTDNGWCAGEGPQHQVARRADLLVAGAGYFGYADVAVTHPTAAARIGRSANPAVAEQPLAAAKLRESEKQQVYAACPAFAGVDVTPVVLESFGGIGAQAVALLRLLAKRTEQPAAMLQRGIDMLAVALVKGNSALEQHAVPLVLRSAYASGALARSHAPAPELRADDDAELHAQRALGRRLSPVDAAAAACA
jgi:hypothetical protein